MRVLALYVLFVELLTCSFDIVLTPSFYSTPPLPFPPLPFPPLPSPPQIFSVLFWLIDHYYYYAVAMFFIASVSVLISLIQTRRYMQQLRDMVSTYTTVTVIRDGKGTHAITVNHEYMSMCYHSQ